MVDFKYITHNNVFKILSTTCYFSDISLHIPSFILCNGALFELASDGRQHFTCIISKVQIANFCWWHGNDGKGLFVLFYCGCSNLQNIYLILYLQETTALHLEKTISYLPVTLQVSLPPCQWGCWCCEPKCLCTSVLASHMSSWD